MKGQLSAEDMKTLRSKEILRIFIVNFGFFSALGFMAPLVSEFSKFYCLGKESRIICDISYAFLTHALMRTLKWIQIWYEKEIVGLMSKYTDKLCT